MASPDRYPPLTPLSRTQQIQQKIPIELRFLHSAYLNFTHHWERNSASALSDVTPRILTKALLQTKNSSSDLYPTSSNSTLLANRVKSLLEIILDVINMLDSHRNPNHIRRYS